jgi:hypothetical protein
VISASAAIGVIHVLNKTNLLIGQPRLAIFWSCVLSWRNCDVRAHRSRAIGVVQAIDRDQCCSCPGV